MIRSAFARTRILTAAAGAALLLLAAPSHAADVQGIQQRWNQMDRCTKTARDRFPGTSAEVQAKREAFMRQCQRYSRLPERQVIPPPPSGNATAEPAQ